MSVLQHVCARHYIDWADDMDRLQYNGGQALTCTEKGRRMDQLGQLADANFKMGMAMGIGALLTSVIPGGQGVAVVLGAGALANAYAAQKISNGQSALANTACTS